MKKVVLAFLSVILLAGSTFAQDRPKAATKAKINAAQPQQSRETQSDAAPSNGRTKKDGSADMRYKANRTEKKAEIAPSGPAKKIGTPEMRNKATKNAKAYEEKK